MNLLTDCVQSPRGPVASKGRTKLTVLTFKAPTWLGNHQLKEIRKGEGRTIRWTMKGREQKSNQGESEESQFA